jgi:hypothetical protein
MEPRRRVLRAAALTSSVVLVGGFIGYGSGMVVFLAGSKTSPVFRDVNGVEIQPGLPRVGTRSAVPARPDE